MRHIHCKRSTVVVSVASIQSALEYLENASLRNRRQQLYPRTKQHLVYDSGLPP